MITLLLKRLEEASESSWHEIWNLNDRTITGRNEKISFRKREDMGTRNQMCLGEEATVPFICRVRSRSQPGEPALGRSVSVLMIEQWSAPSLSFL